MISLTKNHQKEEVILQMVRIAFDPLDAIEVKELTEGFYNVAYLIKLSDEKEVILKIAPPITASIMSYEKNLMLAEVESMRMIRKNTKVPVPEVLYYSVEHNTYNLCDSQYFFMTKIEGSNYNSVKSSLTEQERDQIDYEVGKYNRQMNEIIGSDFGYYALIKDKDLEWKTVFEKMIQDVLQDGTAKNIDIGMDYKVFWDSLLHNTDVLESVKIPRFVHWDLWDGNIFVKDGHVEGIIDFERAIWGDPLMEVAFRANNKNGKETSFMNGYGKIEQNADAMVSTILYDIYLYLIMTIECDYRQYPDNNQYHWAKNMLADAMKRLDSREN